MLAPGRRGWHPWGRCSVAPGGPPSGTALARPPAQWAHSAELMDRGLQEVAAPGPFPGEKQRRRRREAGRGAGAARGGAGAPGPAAHTHPQIPQGVPAPPLASIPRRPGSLRATGVPKTDVPFSLPPSRPPHRGVGQGAHPVPGLSTTPRGRQPPALLVGTPQGIPIPGRTALPRLPREGALSHQMNLVLIGVPRGMGRTVPRPARLLLLPRGLLGGRNVPLCFEPSPICFLQPRIPSTGFHPCRGSPSLSTSPPRALGCRGGSFKHCCAWGLRSRHLPGGTAPSPRAQTDKGRHQRVLRAGQASPRGRGRGRRGGQGPLRGIFPKM